MNKVLDLPDEMLLSIFKHIRLQDLVQCRLVCSRFLSICNSIQIDEFIIAHKIGNIKDHWFHTHKPFNFKDAFHPMHLFSRGKNNFPGYRKLFKFESHLKRLCFDGGCVTTYREVNLNSLTQLVQLRMGLYEIEMHSGVNIDINLPNLKILEIVEHFSDISEIYLTTPKLEMLKCHKFESIHLRHPNTVRHLELVLYTDTADVLVNLQYLKVNWQEIRPRKIFPIFPRLRTLMLIWNGVEKEEDFDASMNDLRLLVARKPSNLKIYFESVELAAIAKINEFKLPESVLAFQINNYDLLCANVDFNGPLDYNVLIKLFNGKLPNDFFKKYFNCRAVKAADNVCQEHFVWFLKNFKYLNRLELTDTRLDQAFYDGLVDLDQLTELIVKNSHISNHDFLLKMTLLEEFTTDDDSVEFLDLACVMCSELEHFHVCRFYVKQKYVNILKIEHCQMFEFRLLREIGNGSKDITFRSTLMGLDNLLRLVNEYKSFVLL